MLTIIADLRWTSRWSELADKKEVICSNMLSWILGVCRGKQMAKSCSAEFTTSVAGGLGRSNASIELRTYKAIESCSRALHTGESS